MANPATRMCKSGECTPGLNNASPMVISTKAPAIAMSTVGGAGHLHLGSAPATMACCTRLTVGHGQAADIGFTDEFSVEVCVG